MKVLATTTVTLLLAAGLWAGCKKSEKDKRHRAITPSGAGPTGVEMVPSGGAPGASAPAVMGVPEPPTTMPVAGAAQLDLGSPEKTLTAVFDAARSGDTSKLISLCAADGDGDVKQICAMTPQHPEWAEFAKAFKDGKITAPAAITGNEATVEFSFGPDGTERETMQLTNVGGKWLLSGF